MWANFIGCKRCSDHQAPHKRIDSYLILVRRKFAAIFLSPFYKPRPALPTTSDPVIISIISQRKKEIRLRLKVLFNVRGFFFFSYIFPIFFFLFFCLQCYNDQYFISILLCEEAVQFRTKKIGRTFPPECHLYLYLMFYPGCKFAQITSLDIEMLLENSILYTQIINNSYIRFFYLFLKIIFFLLFPPYLLWFSFYS